MKRLVLALTPLTLVLAATACGGSGYNSPEAAAGGGSGAAVAASSSQSSGSAAGRGAYGASSASTSAVTPAASGSTAAPAAKGPDGPAVVSTKTTKLGSVLADAKGMTLYLWAADTGSASVCIGPCAQFWPPLLTKGAPTASGSAEAGLLGSSPRADGTTQVTYDGHPLYTFLKDKDRGDEYGQGSDGFGAKWWVVAPAGKAIATTQAAPASSAPATTAAAASSAGGTVVATKTTKLGPILADGRGMTLYLWVADRGAKSVCTGQCAAFWPPLLAKGAPTASGETKAAELGTTRRADGTTQVTYDGHPLYTFAKDKDRGDRYGQGSDGFGAKWWIMAPDGTAITG